MTIRRRGWAARADEEVGILIIGAGPTGLALAAQLRSFGVPFRLVDRRLDRTHESRALAIQPRTLEVLSGLGVSRSLVERGNQTVRLRMHFGARVLPVRLFDLGLEDTAYPFLLFISQAETEAILNEHLAARGVHVERGVELVGFDAGASEVTCTLRHPDGGTEQVRARYLVGCDGAHSTVRHGAGIPFEGGSYPQTFALADLEVEGELERCAVHAFVSPLGVFFLFPLGKPATWRLIGMRPRGVDEGDGERDMRELSLRDLQSICDAYTGGTLRLRDPAWLTYFRLHHRHAAQYRQGRVFLAGDAAHVHSPAGAQGMNTGIQDAWNLGWKLALVVQGVAEESLLDSYEAERRPVGLEVLRLTDRAFTLATSPGRLIRVVRTRVVPRLAPLALRSRAGRAYGFRAISQLAVGYKRSPAVEEGSPSLRRGPRAGDRLPDACISRDGRTLRLHEALGEPGYHLLLCGPASAWDERRVAAVGERYAGLLAVHRLAPHAAPGVLWDTDGEAFVRLGVERAAQYLVRPDGHIGFRCAGADLGGLERYLVRWLPAPAGQGGELPPGAE